MGANIDRKEAIRKYKERKTPRGVFAMRCTATGRVWVGTSLNLDATRNGLWYMLSQGLHQDRALQEEWNSQGEGTFQYQIVETIGDGEPPLGLNDLLKEKKLHWIAQFGASSV